MTRLLFPHSCRVISPVLDGCGNVFVRGAIRTGSTIHGSAIQGSVSVVQMGSVLNGQEGPFNFNPTARPSSSLRLFAEDEGCPVPCLAGCARQGGGFDFL